MYSLTYGFKTSQLWIIYCHYLNEIVIVHGRKKTLHLLHVLYVWFVIVCDSPFQLSENSNAFLNRMLNRDTITRINYKRKMHSLYLTHTYTHLFFLSLDELIQFRTFTNLWFLD